MPTKALLPPIYGAAAASTYAPYINSLITPGNANAQYVSYAKDYHNVLSTPTGANPSIHPSEPNYLWQEAGTNYNTNTAPNTANNGINNDNDPFGSGQAVQAIQNLEAANPGINTQNLSGMLQNAGISWNSYQEDIDLATANGSNENLLTGGAGNLVTSGTVASNQNTVPLSSFSGTSTSYTNPYNGSHQYNFAAKHDGSLFYADTNGGYTVTTSGGKTAYVGVTGTNNVEVSHYEPLQSLASDLANNTVGKYNLITPGPVQ